MVTSNPLNHNFLSNHKKKNRRTIVKFKMTFNEVKVMQNECLISNVKTLHQI